MGRNFTKIIVALGCAILQFGIATAQPSWREARPIFTSPYLEAHQAFGQWIDCKDRDWGVDEDQRCGASTLLCMAEFLKSATEDRLETVKLRILFRDKPHNPETERHEHAILAGVIKNVFPHWPGAMAWVDAASVKTFKTYKAQVIHRDGLSLIVNYGNFVDVPKDFIDVTITRKSDLKKFTLPAFGED